MIDDDMPAIDIPEDFEESGFVEEDDVMDEDGSEAGHSDEMDSEAAFQNDRWIKYLESSGIMPSIHSALSQHAGLAEKSVLEFMCPNGYYLVVGSEYGPRIAEIKRCIDQIVMVSYVDDNERKNLTVEDIVTTEIAIESAKETYGYHDSARYKFVNPRNISKYKNMVDRKIYQLIEKGQYVELQDAKNPKIVSYAKVEKNCSGILMLHVFGCKKGDKFECVHMFDSRVHHVGWAKEQDPETIEMDQWVKYSPTLTLTDFSDIKKETAPKLPFERNLIAPHYLKIGSMLEVASKDKTKFYYAHVSNVHNKHYVELRIGDELDSSLIETIAHIGSSHIFPVGHCASINMTPVMPGIPNESIGWEDYQRMYSPNGEFVTKCGLMRNVRKEARDMKIPTIKYVEFFSYYRQRFFPALVTRAERNMIWLSLHYTSQIVVVHYSDPHIFPVGQGMKSKICMFFEPPVSVIGVKYDSLTSGLTDIYDYCNENVERKTFIPHFLRNNQLVPRVYVNKKCSVGPYLDYRAVQALCNFFEGGAQLQLFRLMVKTIMQCSKDRSFMHQLYSRALEDEGLMQTIQVKYKKTPIDASSNLKTIAPENATQFPEFLKAFLNVISACPNLFSFSKLEDGCKCPSNCKPQRYVPIPTAPLLQISVERAKTKKGTPLKRIDGKENGKEIHETPVKTSTKAPRIENGNGVAGEKKKTKRSLSPSALMPLAKKKSELEKILESDGPSESAHSNHLTPPKKQRLSIDSVDVNAIVGGMKKTLEKAGLEKNILSPHAPMLSPMVTPTSAKSEGEAKAAMKASSSAQQVASASFSNIFSNNRTETVKPDKPSSSTTPQDQKANAEMTPCSSTQSQKTPTAGQSPQFGQGSSHTMFPDPRIFRGAMNLPCSFLTSNPQQHGNQMPKMVPPPGFNMNMYPMMNGMTGFPGMFGPMGFGGVDPRNMQLPRMLAQIQEAAMKQQEQEKKKLDMMRLQQSPMSNLNVGASTSAASPAISVGSGAVSSEEMKNHESKKERPPVLDSVENDEVIDVGTDERPIIFQTTIDGLASPMPNLEDDDEKEEEEERPPVLTPEAVGPSNSSSVGPSVSECVNNSMMNSAKTVINIDLADSREPSPRLSLHIPSPSNLSVSSAKGLNVSPKARSPSSRSDRSGSNIIVEKPTASVVRTWTCPELVNYMKVNATNVTSDVQNRIVALNIDGKQLLSMSVDECKAKLNFNSGLILFRFIQFILGDESSS